MSIQAEVERWVSTNKNVLGMKGITILQGPAAGTYLDKMSAFKHEKATVQRVLDIMFLCMMKARVEEPMKSMDNEKLAEWVRNQLGQCGIHTEAMRSSWAVINMIYED